MYAQKRETLDLRGLIGGGVGRHVYQSTKTQLSLIGAADFTREKYTGKDFTAPVRYESYDSDPPIEDVAKNDFSVSTSLGWKF